MSSIPRESFLFVLAFLAQAIAAVRLLLRARRSQLYLDFIQASSPIAEHDAALLQENTSGEPTGIYALAFNWNETIAEHLSLTPLERATAAASAFGDWFQSLLSYRFLERMAIIAPLLGLLVTCWGLFREQINLEDIQASMRPLVFGVGGGAAIAMANQFLLFAVQSRAAAIQYSIRTDLRKHFSPGAASTQPTDSLHALVTHTLEVLRVAEERNDTLVQMLKHLDARFVAQADQQTYAAERLLHTFDALPAHLSSVTRAIGSAEAVFASSASTFTQVSGTLQEGIHGFNETISSQLTPLVRSHAANLDAIDRITVNSSNAIEGLGETVGLLKAAAMRHEDLTKAYRDSIEEVVIPSQKQVRDAASKIASATRSLTAPLEGLIAAIGALGARVDAGSESFEQLRQGAERFSESVDQALTPALRNHLVIAEDLRKSATQVLAAAEEMRSGVSGLDVSSQYQATTTDRMLSVIETKVIPTYHLLERTALSLEGAVQMFVENADDLRKATLAQADSATSLRREVAVVVKSFADAGSSLAKHDAAVHEPLTAITTLINHTSDLTTRIQPALGVLQAGVEGLQATLQDNAKAKNDLAEAVRANEAIASVLADSANAIKEATHSVCLMRTDAAEVILPYLRQLHDEIEKIRRVNVAHVAASEVAAAVSGAIEPLRRTIDTLAANVARTAATQEGKRGWFR